MNPKLKGSSCREIYVNDQNKVSEGCLLHDNQNIWEANAEVTNKNLSITVIVLGAVIPVQRLGVRDIYFHSHIAG